MATQEEGGRGHVLDGQCFCFYRETRPLLVNVSFVLVSFCLFFFFSFFSVPGAVSTISVYRKKTIDLDLEVFLEPRRTFYRVRGVRSVRLRGQQAYSISVYNRSRYLQTNPGITHTLLNPVSTCLKKTNPSTLRRRTNLPPKRRPPHL